MNPFQPLIDRMRSLEFPLNDEGSERVRIEPPATKAQLAEVERRLGRPIPRALAQLLEVTTGFDGTSPEDGDAELELDPLERGLVAGHDLGLGELFEVYDYGNGDHMYLEPNGDDCRLWWFGHDSWLAVLVAERLEEYVERSVVYLEGVAANQAWFEAGEEGEERQVPPNPREPRFDQEPCTREEALEALAEDAAPELREFLTALPANAWVYGFSGSCTPVEPELPDSRRLKLEPGFMRRCGRYLALIPDLQRAPVVEAPEEPFVARALALASMEMFDAALKELHHALELTPGNPRVQSWIDDLSRRRGAV